MLIGEGDREGGNGRGWEPRSKRGGNLTGGKRGQEVGLQPGRNTETYM